MDKLTEIAGVRTVPDSLTNEIFNRFHVVVGRAFDFFYAFSVIGGKIVDYAVQEVLHRP